MLLVPFLIKISLFPLHTLNIFPLQSTQLPGISWDILANCCIMFTWFSLSFIVTMQVIAAITYQIVPADTHHAEIPLAAVSSIYQHKVFLSFHFQCPFCDPWWFVMVQGRCRVLSLQGMYC